MREGDVPGSSKVVEPLMYHLALYGDQNRLKRLTRRLVDAGVSFTASTSKIFRDNPVISREIMNRILGETFSISPKPFNDAFCARLFATKALSVSLIVTGMQVLGVDAIGPLSTRELAVREGRPETIRERIDQMRAAGISIGSSRFSRLVEKFAVENEAHLLEQLLASDQHPETLEDQQLQESLLASHMAAQNWRKMKTSLIIQTAFSKQPHIERWNLLLRGHLALRRLNAARQTLDEMLVGGIPVSAISCKALLQSVLRPRNPGKRPVSCAPHHQEDDLSTIINMLMGIVQSGRSLPPTSWKEIFLRLGQTGRLDELERLAIWLAAFYSPQTAEAAYARFSPHRTLPRTRLPSATPSVPKTLSPSHPSHPLRQLFPANFHRAVIAWGFLSPPASLSTTTTLTSPSHPSPLTTTSPPWTRGLRLLATLRSYGVAIRTPVLRKAFQQRLLVLFGPGTSSRPANRLARARNAVPMHVMVADARDMWGDDILDGLELPGVDGELTRAVAGGGGAEREEGMIGGEETVEGKGGVDGG
ncbi:MAG: hypothetical protein M1832_002690 [Thelocarpon impressellum]|nr:MAG: hypothetical protein M1832_002690 [Thelocarpon impressellum]